MRSISTEQVGALWAFAEKHGDDWRRELQIQWMHGGPLESPPLYALRNTHGPRWLFDFALPQASDVWWDGEADPNVYGPAPALEDDLTEGEARAEGYTREDWFGLRPRWRLHLGRDPLGRFTFEIEIYDDVADAVIHACERRFETRERAMQGGLRALERFRGE